MDGVTRLCGMDGRGSSSVIHFSAVSEALSDLSILSVQPLLGVPQSLNRCNHSTGYSDRCLQGLRFQQYNCLGAGINICNGACLCQGLKFVVATVENATFPVLYFRFSSSSCIIYLNNMVSLGLCTDIYIYRIE